MDNNLNERVKAFQSEISPLLQKHSLKMGAVPIFPIYKILPVEVELALKVLEKHGVQYTVGFQELAGKENK